MMQSQGLGALMPQSAQQQAPQMNNPRLNAAVDVVSSDAEKQILDPRTLALLKYKDAIQAMQAADQMMAAAQPQLSPPTVAERTKQAAEQGIAGLASRLSPGIQQQGGNMQAQQMQQAMSGGLPQLPAPNMARMAGGGIVGFQEGGRPEDADPVVAYHGDGTPIRASEMAVIENASAVAPAQSAPVAAQPSKYTTGLEAVLEQVQGQKFDPEAAADARSAELRRLAGADDLIAQRAEAERSRRELAETRFSPEAQRRRALRAGLAGLAERGLGGFSAGAGAEDERIYAEQAAESERSVAEMDRLIADFRQMGLTEFEARNAARASVQGQADTQTQRQADILSTLAEGEDAAAGRAVQREQIAAQERAAMAQVNRPTDAMNEINIRADAAMAADPTLNRTDALKRAVDERVAVDIRAQLASAGIEGERLNTQIVRDATDMAAAKLKNRMDLLTNPDAYNEAFEKALTDAIALIRSEVDQNRQYAVNPSTGERIVSRDGGATWQSVQ